MSKLVDGIKDRMVAAACEAAPTVVDAAQKAVTAAARKLSRLSPMQERGGGASVTSEPATVAEPVAAAHAPEARSSTPRPPTQPAPGHRRGLHHR